MSQRTRDARIPLPKRRVGGSSLLEVLAAAAIIGGSLVPTLALMRDSLTLSRHVERVNLLAVYGVSQLETELGLLAADWTARTGSGDWASQGEPRIRYLMQASDAESLGGIPGRLLAVSVTAFDDANGDRILGSDETGITFRTKLGRFATYQPQ